MFGNGAGPGAGDGTVHAALAPKVPAQGCSSDAARCSGEEETCVYSGGYTHTG